VTQFILSDGLDETNIIEMNCLPYFLHILRKRSLFNVMIHDINTEFGKRSIKYKGCKLWNNLPIDIKTIKSSYSFKFKLKHLLLQFLE